MPTPQNRSRRRSPPRREGTSGRRRGEDSASLAGYLFESDSSSSSTASGVDGGASLPRYQSILASRLARLRIPPSADDGSGDDDDDQDLPSPETLEALTSRSFLDNEMRDALVEFHVQNCLSDKTHGRRDSGEFHSADVAMNSVDSGDTNIQHEDCVKDCAELLSRRTQVDVHTKLDKQQLKEINLRHAHFRIKALLLLKGKSAIGKLDHAALERKYPRELIVENSYFLGYHDHDAFGWYFDSDLCRLASLTDYQRLVLSNYGGDEYEDWSRYRSYYNTPETDRDYLLYWVTMAEKIKWIGDYIHRGRTSDEWANMEMKARHQAVRIATGFHNIHLDLACLGFDEFIWSTRLNVLYLKDLDGVIFEIWKRVIKKKSVQMCFREALKEVYDLKMFPSRQRCMKDELDHRLKIEQQFRRCTVGITEEVPEYRAHDLIAQQVKNKFAMIRGYERYAEKKLKIAECIGLICKIFT